MPVRFEIDKEYSRADVREKIELPRDITGGPWLTGIVEHDGEFFIFANVGNAGRTGHNYKNEWDDGFLRWQHKKNSNLTWPSVNRLLMSGALIHLFSRKSDRDYFRYHGYAIPVEVIDESSPVDLVLAVTHDPPQRIFLGGSEIVVLHSRTEGNPRSVDTTMYERNQKARRDCIKYYGAQCCVCGLRFEDRYGSIGRDYIHVHHLVPISQWGKAYQVDPVEDLRPICPNCHAMVHRKTPPHSIEFVGELLQNNEGQAL